MATLGVENDRSVSEQSLQLERARLWPQVWLCAGRASDAARPGDYFTFELDREVMLVVNDAGTLRAFHNVCQHRGHPLRPCGRGTAAALRCPYHGWTYALSGRLEHVPDRHTFPGQVPTDEFSLKPLGCEQRAGFIWVHFGEAREPLSDFLGELEPALDACAIGQWCISQDVTLELPANWKTLPDVGNDDAKVDYQLYALHSSAQLADRCYYRVFPNLKLAVGAEDAMLYRSRPHPEDPQRSFLDVWGLGPSSGRARPPHENWLTGDKRAAEVLGQLGAGQASIRHTHAALERYLSR